MRGTATSEQAAGTARPSRPARAAAAALAAGLLRVARHEHAVSLIVSMAGTVILWLPATTS